MAQVAVNTPSSLCPSPIKAKRLSILSSGRGGSGNIRNSQVSSAGPRDTPVPSSRTDDKRPECSEPPSERRGVEQRHFTSSGRGGSGNIQPSTCDLGSHPLTASILSQHNAALDKYEEWIRKVHAESNRMRSSGRGGSGNISDARRRSSSQGPSTVPKKRFFTTKGREKATKSRDDAAQARDGEEGSNRDKRTSHATYSSGGSSAFEARYSQDGPINGAVISTNRMSSDCLPCEGAVPGRSGKRRSFLVRWNKVSSTGSMAPPVSPRSPSAALTHSPGSYIDGPVPTRVHSHTSLILEDHEYVSFLEL